MKLTADDVLTDLREYIALRGFTMTAKLAEVLGWVERFSETVNNDPFPNFFLLGLLRISREFRDIVANLGGDPDAGAELIESDVERDVEEEYGDSPLYSEPKDRASDRPAIIDYAMESARIDGRTDLQVRDLANGLVRYQVHIEKTDGRGGVWLDRTMRTPFLTLAHIAGQFDKSLDVKLVDVRRAIRGEPGARLPKHVSDGIRRLLEDHPDMRRNGFVIMPFASEHDAVRVAIEETLSAHRLRALRADASSYSSDLLSNIEIYMHACGFAVALYDPANPNVVYEAGYMRALGKPVWLLVPRGAPMHADVAGLLRVDFDPADVAGSIRRALSKWLAAERIVEQDSGRPDYDSARKTMIEHAVEFSWKAFNEFVMDLASRGWTRRDVYELTLEILNDQELQLAERSRDELLDFEGSLRGDCAPECIPRFPNDPEDVEELARVARSKDWLSGDHPIR